MSVLDRLALAWQILKTGGIQGRQFVVGPAVVYPGDEAWGRDQSTYSPPEYGDYIATSNAVYTCVTSRAQYLSSLPLRLKRGDDLVERGPLFELLQKVNPRWTMQRFIEMTEMSLGLWGQSYSFLERGTSGRQPPREIWWARPTLVRPVPDPVDYLKGFLLYPETGLEPIFYTPDEVLWFRYPNPLDEYAALSPLAAARLSADYAAGAMKSNKNLFENGMQPGGLIMPKAGATLTGEQARDFEGALARRMKGVDKAHRWAAMTFEAEVWSQGITPKDMDFIAGLRWSLEEVCRAYRWPLDLVGGQRTYENVDAAMKAAWTNAVLPEGRFIASELQEMLLPMFPGQADEVFFDSSNVDVLQQDENERWTRAKEQIQCGAITVNEWREEEGLDPLPWGDAWWASRALTPILSSELPPEPEPAVEAEVPEAEEPPLATEPAEEDAAGEILPEPARALPALGRASVAYGGPEHTRLFERFVRRSDPWERELTAVTVGLFERQRDSVRAAVESTAPAELAESPFDKARWVKEFRTGARPLFTRMIGAAYDDAVDDLPARGLTVRASVSKAAARFIEKRVQRFAEQVNETTWQELQQAFRAGLEAGDNIPGFMERVLAVMEDRIRSTPETIARTEVNGGLNGGTLLAWRETEIVRGKEWISALDDRTRTPPESQFDHVGAHGEQVELDEPFTATGEALDHPGGDGGSAGNVINCRCSMAAVL